MLIHKLAAAAAGQSLEQVAALTREAAELGSISVAPGACTVSAAGRPSFEIGPAEIELGLGIHGEQGLGAPR